MMVAMLMIIVVAVIASVAGVAIAKRHKHDYKARAVQHMTMRTTKYPVGVDITEVLYVCACGDAETKQFEAHWKLSDFIVDGSEVDTELARLRKMAGVGGDD